MKNLFFGLYKVPEALKKLIQSIGYLPGIGENRATKLAFFLLHANNNYLENFCENIKGLKTKVHSCSICHSLTDTANDICNICSNPKRNKDQIAVVEEYLDMLTIENAAGFTGTYHILGGAISPINGVFIGDLHFETLFKRIEESDNKIELILATNPNLEGEATANYLKEEIEKRKLKYKVTITRLSRGLSSGYLEYADNTTLVNALKERKEM